MTGRRVDLETHRLADAGNGPLDLDLCQWPCPNGNARHNPTGQPRDMLIVCVASVIVCVCVRVRRHRRRGRRKETMGILPLRVARKHNLPT